MHSSEDVTINLIFDYSRLLPSDSIHEIFIPDCDFHSIKKLPTPDLAERGYNNFSNAFLDLVRNSIV